MPADEATPAAPFARLDLEACAREPIRHPGAIQPHGCLLSIDGGGWIRQASANVAVHLERDAESLLGLPLDQVLGPRLATWAGRDGRRRWTNRRGGVFWLHALANGTGRLLEIEAEGSGPDAAPAMAADRAALVRAPDAFKAADAAARLAAATTGFDRILVYRFNPDHSGEVIAERLQIDRISYLGLRYPASDIPPQARALYLAVPIRQLVNAHASPAPLVPLLDPMTGGPLDLGAAELRAMSPIHLEYLSNMGVAASLTASVIVAGRLWGLVTCHQHAPAWVAPPRRRQLRQIADRLGAVLGRLERREEGRTARALAVLRPRLAQLADQGIAGLEQLLLSRRGLRQRIDAHGLALCVGGVVIAGGNCPEPEWLTAFAAAVVTRGSGLVSTSLVEDLPALPPRPGAASGALAALLPTEPPAVLAAFRPEVVGSVTWGGNPDRPAEWDPERGRLSPRRSFEQWKQELRNHCQPWEPRACRLFALAADSLGSLIATEPLARLAQRLGHKLSGERPVRRDLLDTLDEGIVLVVGRRLSDGGFDVEVANDSFRKAFGLKGQIRHQPLERLLAALDLPGELADPAFTAFPMHCTLWTAGRGRRWFSIERRPIYAVAGIHHPSQLQVILLQDITRFRQAEEAVSSARRQIEDALAQQERLLASASHELRTPLNAILGFSEMIQSEMFGPVGHPTYADYARDIHRAGRHLLDLVNDLLQLSAGQRALAAPPLAVGPVAEELLRLMEVQARRAGIRLTQAIDGPVTVPLEERSLRQILINLLSNALKFTAAGGSVALTAGEADQQVWLQVADTGIGMTEADLGQIFTPFFRAGNVYTSSTEGTGLGLSIVRILVEASGGRVHLSSRFGQGTVVRAVWPRPPAGPAQGPPATGAAPPPARPG